jgi:hypothetical protein
MTETQKDRQAAVVDGTDESSKVGSRAAASSPRRQYSAPRLRYLGSVQELTWGASGLGGDDEGRQP